MDQKDKKISRVWNLNKDDKCQKSFMKNIFFIIPTKSWERKDALNLQYIYIFQNFF